MFKNQTVKARLFSLIMLMVVIMIGLSGLNLYALYLTNKGLQTVYLDRTVPLGDLGEIKMLQIRNSLYFSNIALEPEKASQALEVVIENNDQIKVLWEGYLLTFLTPEEKVLADKYSVSNKAFLNEAFNPMIEHLKKGELEEVQKIRTTKLKSTVNRMGKDIDALIQLQKDVAKQEYEASQTRYKTALFSSVLMEILGVALSVVIGMVITRRLIKELGGEPNYAASIVKEVANGNLSVNVDLQAGDNSSLLYSISKMRETLNNTILSVNFTMADIAKGDLSSRITGEFKGDFSNIQSGMNKSLDTISDILFDIMRVTNAIANGTLSSKITDASASFAGSENRKKSRTLASEYQGKFLEARVSINKTVDGLTAMIEEIEQIVHSGAECGDFSVKMSLHDKVGYSKRIAELINQLFETTEESLNDVLAVSESLARGDLTKTIDKDYVGAFAAVKSSLNNTVENLKHLIGEIKDTSHVIAIAAREISAGNNDLSKRTQEQAASLEETAASMEELTSTISKNTSNAQHASTTVDGASIAAKEGVRVVNNVVHTMNNINESSRKIVDIISAIDDIAFQTNILALNAAVEASRAGEQGKGFAVVATEVRSLAQRAAKAAGEIKALIDASVASISDGSKQVEQAGKTMENIVESIQNTTTMMNEIVNASLEQSQGIKLIYKAITQIDGVTQQNAALVEQASAATDALKQQTENLSNEMSNFTYH